MLRTRFAPSPTGELHLGHAVHILYVFGAARALGAEIQFRMEDHDRLRCRPEYADSIRKDLCWLGFLRGDEPWTFQSQRQGRYAAVLEALRDRGLVYACGCSRKDLVDRYRARGLAPREGEIPYDGHCRDRRLPFGPGRSMRLKVGPETVAAVDLLRGPFEQTPAESCGDVSLIDNRGHFTYQFCVVVDDLDNATNLVIRGEDIFPSTGRQLVLLRILGGRAPTYLHHPLVRGKAGEKLSKRYRSLSLRALREQGHSPADVLGMAAAEAGLLPPGSRLHHADVAALFADRFSRELERLTDDTSSRTGVTSLES